MKTCHADCKRRRVSHRDLKTFNQSRASTLKVLVESKEAIFEALVTQDLTSVDIVPCPID